MAVGFVSRIQRTATKSESEIQKTFRINLGIYLDKVKQGVETLNDGKILLVISLKKKLRGYAIKTAALFVSKYAWYYMPVIIHKILINEEYIIKNALIYIELVSKEVQEARNKYFGESK